MFRAFKGVWRGILVMEAAALILLIFPMRLPLLEPCLSVLYSLVFPLYAAYRINQGNSLSLAQKGKACLLLIPITPAALILPCRYSLSACSSLPTMESMRLSFLYTAGCSLLFLLCFGSMLLLPVLHPDYRGKQLRLLLLQKARYFLFYSIINLLVFLCSQPVFTALGLYSQWYPLILLPVLVSFPAAVLVFGWAIERKNCCSVKELFSLSLLCFATVLLFWEYLFLRTASADTFAENFVAALILSVFHTLLFFEVCFASKIASRFLQNRRG